MQWSVCKELREASSIRFLADWVVLLISWLGLYQRYWSRFLVKFHQQAAVFTANKVFPIQTEFLLFVFYISCFATATICVTYIFVILFTSSGMFARLFTLGIYAVRSIHRFFNRYCSSWRSLRDIFALSNPEISSLDAGSESWFCLMSKLFTDHRDQCVLLCTQYERRAVVWTVKIHPLVHMSVAFEAHLTLELCLYLIGNPKRTGRRSPSTTEH